MPLCPQECGEASAHAGSLHFHGLSGKNDARDFWRFCKVPVDTWTHLYVLVVGCESELTWAREAKIISPDPSSLISLSGEALIFHSGFLHQCCLEQGLHYATDPTYGFTFLPRGSMWTQSTGHRPTWQLQLRALRNRTRTI